jgi:hypothetical protein
MIELIALILLMLRVTATGFLLNVLKKQRKLMTRPIDAEINGFRKHLYYLTLGLAGSNALPIVFDAFIIAKGLGVPALSDVSSQPLIVAYAISNAAAALLAAILVQKIYRNALEVDESHKSSDHTLMND